MEPGAVVRYWKSQRFLGFGDSQPISFESIEAIRTYVARQEAALGYVPFAAVDASVRIVESFDGRKIDAGSVSAADYPLSFAP